MSAHIHWQLTPLRGELGPVYISLENHQVHIAEEADGHCLVEAPADVAADCLDWLSGLVWNALDHTEHPADNCPVCRLQ